MQSDRPIRVARRANLARVIAQPDIGSAAALARLLGKSTIRVYFSQIAQGHRDMGDDLAADIERAIGAPPGWMDEDHSNEGYALYDAGFVGNSGEQNVSDTLPTISWEELVSAGVPAAVSLPDRFVVSLRDDALAPDHPKGTELVWTTRRKPMPGRLVLVRDRHGQIHARECRQGREPGRWIAAAVNPAYISFESTDVELVAVYKGRLEPDDE